MNGSAKGKGGMCFFMSKKETRFMPRNQIQRMVFAFLTVLVTVHGYVFYSLYVVNGNTLMQVNVSYSVLNEIDNKVVFLYFCRMIKY